VKLAAAKQLKDDLQKKILPEGIIFDNFGHGQQG
jgi:hypothetical protein